jgi:hypothetical protein
MARGEQASGDLGRGEFGSRCEAGNGLSRIVLIGWKPCSERNSHLNRVRSIWPVFTGAGLPPARALPISTRSDYADIAQKRISEYTQVKSLPTLFQPTDCTRRPSWTFGLEEHMPISAIGARAHLIGPVLFVFWGV